MKAEEGSLIERVEIAMEMVRSMKAPMNLTESLDEIFGILASIQRDLYTMERNIKKVEDLADQVFKRAEGAEARTRFFLGLLGGEKGGKK